MASKAVTENAVLSVMQWNKKHYQASLMDGQHLELVVDMFNVQVMHAGRPVAKATFQPLSSLNNLEMQPVYKLAAFQDDEGENLHGCQPLLETVFAVYAYYTNGSIRPWRQAVK
ncbi:hypothetical protein [Methylophilus sp. TWE2]|uniref:hypothetical protein n=1 Tax=Methylophilus sp. TWE2 TaxID=1662285 RepID=UPI000670B140|nr:hypothetical protein [Methylophilus sp. TWE2]AKR42597.1 hypothetical protein ACJ67_03470 [Methylophilus sp. TWE2]